jgi:methyltransferase family protein
LGFSWHSKRVQDASDARDCPVCGAAQRRIRRLGELETTGQIRYQRDRYDLVQCTMCELIFISPLPSEVDLRSIYVDSIQFSDDLYTEPERVRAILEYMTDCLTRLLVRMGRPRNDPISVLEVGAGLAWMGRAAKALNESSATTGQDISPEAVHRCPWVDSYVRGDLLEVDLEKRAPYNVISLTHVIEHLVDPGRVIQRLKPLMAIDGAILLTAPHRPPGWTRGSTDMAIWKAYSYNHVPAHIQYFSMRSMKTLAQNAGLHLDYWSAASEGGQAFEAWLR